MAVVYERAPWRKRLQPWVEGFDGPLALAVFLLASAGLLCMYSAGFDHGTRFADHARNMLNAGFMLFEIGRAHV